MRIDIAPLLTWYAENHRDLPWRRAADNPYAVWVSEIMLQQTQVATVLRYYLRWMERFPTVRVLAEAPLQDVLSQWAGLGYYARARNLHAAAQTVVRQYGAHVPADYDALRALPGIGRYTAGAILSAAFNLPYPIVDTNVIRVLTRVHTLAGDPKSSTVHNRLYDLAQSLLHPDDTGSAPSPRLLNQAIMELGALVCSPSDPGCERCPLVSQCAASRTDDPTAWPQLAPGRAIQRVTHACIVLRDGDRIAYTRRPAHGLWGGLWELPRRECRAGERPGDCAARAAREVLGVRAQVGKDLGTVKHAVTHHAITLHTFEADSWEGEPQALDCAEVRWVCPAEMADLPLSSPQRAIAQHLAL